jgi:phosphate-selective porin OprO/OprP
MIASKCFAACAFACLLASSSPLTAGPLDPVTSEQTEASLCGQLWRIPVIYSDKDNAFLQEFRFTGRLHLDTYNLNSDLGHDQDWIVRRWRMGFKATLLQKLTAHVEVDLNPQDPNPLYSRLTDAYLSWKYSEAMKFTVGKQSVKFTLDGATSSNELITIDRNNVANNFWFPAEYIPGVSLSGKIGKWFYNTGYFSGGTETPEFGNFDAGNFWLGSMGYDLGPDFGMKRAFLRADYVYNDPHPGSTFTRPFEQIGSLVLQLEEPRWGFAAEATAGRGSLSQSDAFGGAVIPWINLTEHLQWVGRYTYIASDENNGVRFSRYESVITGGRGNEYQELYTGLNYYICGHKLKVQTGVTYAWMEDDARDGGAYEGWTWTTGLRLSF